MKAYCAKNSAIFPASTALQMTFLSPSHVWWGLSLLAVHYRRAKSRTIRAPGSHVWLPSRQKWTQDDVSSP